MPEYYQVLYAYLHDRYSNQINRALLDEPLVLRKRYVGRKFNGRGRLPHEEAWELLFPYLETVERALAQIIGKHSAAYWYYLYRRIAPFLSPAHKGKVDPTTIRLVRSIAELGIAKYGRHQIGSDLLPVADRQLRTYLDGLYLEACRVGLKSEEAGQKLLELEASGNNLALGTLSSSDFVDLYRIEGLAYEYWRATATLRAIGKRVDVTWDARRDWFEYHHEAAPVSLFHYYDSRLGQEGGLSTHFGTWFHGQDRPSSFDFFVWSQYSPGEKPETIELPHATEEHTSVTFVPNFRVGAESLSEFWKSHAFMEDAFVHRHGVSLSAVLFAIWTISVRAAVSPVFFEEKTEQGKLRSLAVSQLNLRRRSYTLHSYGLDVLIEDGLSLARILDYPLRVPEKDEALAAGDFIAFTEERQRQIALWAGGKRYPVLTHDTLTLIDVAAIKAFIEGLFFRVGDTANMKGTAFEVAAREFLTQQGFPPAMFGKIRWDDGSEREIDIAVRVGSTLVLFECVSAERPLDFELGRPKTYEKRIEILEEKLAQALSLAEAISASQKGRNFDFTWATQIEWRVLSPHHEFLWADDDHCFTDAHEPRILDPFTAVTYLSGLAGADSGSVPRRR